MSQQPASVVMSQQNRAAFVEGSTLGGSGSTGTPSTTHFVTPETTVNGSLQQQQQQQQIEERASVHRWESMTRTISDYERLEQIGEGTYGQVYRARCLDSGDVVALKKIRVHHGGYWGVPPTVIREIKILKRLKHPRLLKMHEVVSSKGVEYLDVDDEQSMSYEEAERKTKKEAGKSVDSKSSSKKKKDRVVDAREGFKGNLFLVLEYVSHDLTGLIDVGYQFTEVQIKCIFRQLLEALAYMHEQKYVHRDIKSSNILIDSNFRVKLADFGLARCIEPPLLDSFHDRTGSQEFTNKVITLWYRPPEVLLGATRYGTPVDVWSAGCILAELLLSKALFTGKNEMEQLKLIFDLLGTPTEESWDGFMDLKLMRTKEVTIEKRKKPRLRVKYGSKISGPALNLLEKLLELDPAKRLTANRALQSRYFLVEPRAPDRPEDLGSTSLEGHFHEFHTKKTRREAKAVAQQAMEEAKRIGKTEKEAEAEYDVVYRRQMKKAAEDGQIGLSNAPLVKKPSVTKQNEDNVDPKKEDDFKQRLQAKKRAKEKARLAMEEAKSRGASQREADRKYDSVYREEMKKAEDMAYRVTEKKESASQKKDLNRLKEKLLDRNKRRSRDSSRDRDDRDKEHNRDTKNRKHERDEAAFGRYDRDRERDRDRDRDRTRERERASSSRDRERERDSRAERDDGRKRDIDREDERRKKRRRDERMEDFMDRNDGNEQSKRMKEEKRDKESRRRRPDDREQAIERHGSRRDRDADYVDDYKHRREGRDRRDDHNRSRDPLRYDRGEKERSRDKERRYRDKEFDRHGGRDSRRDEWSPPRADPRGGSDWRGEDRDRGGGGEWGSRRDDWGGPPRGEYGHHGQRKSGGERGDNWGRPHNEDNWRGRGDRDRRPGNVPKRSQMDGRRGIR